MYDCINIHMYMYMYTCIYVHTQCMAKNNMHMTACVLCHIIMMHACKLISKGKPSEVCVCVDELSTDLSSLETRREPSKMTRYIRLIVLVHQSDL